MMEVHYLDYLFLDAFSTKELRKPKSLFHIFTGKRTVSVMLQSLKYDISGYFGLFPKLKWEKLEATIKVLLQEELLESVEGGYCLTEKGSKQCTDFFQKHTRILHSNQIRYVRIIPEFKKRSLFLVQVLSERIHQNKQYFPLLEGLAEQNWLKSFLKKIDFQRNDISAVYGREWISLFENIPIIQKDIFMEQFEGHGYVRKTARQVGEQYSLDESEVVVIWQQKWVQILDYLENNSNNGVILNKIYIELKKEGLLWSSSVHETFLLLSNGVKQTELSNRRRLKESTINDHITEIAILYFHFPFERFLNEQQTSYVWQYKKQDSSLDYKEIQKKFPEITFFESRLMQVMNEVTNSYDK